MNQIESNSWGREEFGSGLFGDKRLSDRLVKIADRLGSMPESSINEACGSWAETKAAYRFFQNENIKESEIMSAHVLKTIERIREHKVVLAIQDTSYISYRNHKKTRGLGIIARKR